MTRRIHKRHSPPQLQPLPFQDSKQSSSLSKRRIEEKRSFFDSTMGKVIAVSLILLATVVPFIGLAMYGTAENHAQTTDSRLARESLRTYKHLQNEPLVKFEPYVPGFVHNGKWMVQTNRQDAYSCEVTSSLKALENCEQYGEYIRNIALSDPSLSSQIFSREAFNSKGFKVFVQDVNISLGINPNLRNNYEQALKIAERKVLDPNFADSNIEATLMHINQVLVEGLNDYYDQPIKNGNYRTGAMAIQRDDVAENPEKLKVLVEQRYGKNAFNILISAGHKFFATDSLDTMTEKERQIWNSMYHTSPPAKEVPGLMKKFAADYRQKLKDGEYGFELAAWVHMTLVNIHPYHDAMGREARILMNAELKRGGYSSIVFFDDQEYSKAIEADHKRPGAFRDYLVKAYKHSKALNEIEDFPGPV